MRPLAVAALALAAGGASAHDGVVHAPPPPAGTAVDTAAAFPGRIGGPLHLVDQTGAPRSEVDPAGRIQLVFFGYAKCPGICSHALPTLAALTDALGEAGVAATPVLITVDPEHDTPAALAVAAPEIHPDLVALTGSPDDLAAARAAFQVESELLFVDPALGPIYAHGSYIYLLSADGRFLTLMPPILGVERMVEIVRGYAGS